LKDLDRAAGRKRRELQQLRIETVKGLLGDLVARTRPSRRGGGRRHPDGADADCVIRLGLALAERLGLPPRRRDVLRQALEVRDVGREWVERVLFGRGPFSVAGRERALERHAEHGAEILTALDWPPAVVELVRRQQARGGGDGQPTALCTADLPVEARIMAVMSAFGDLTAGRPADAGAAGIQEALAEIARHAGTRYDPEVVQALIGLGPSRHPGSRQP
jgi:response regulator RpfG family c-di-GMP phosphodiesterase